jgi:hypothetical protein
MRELQNLATLFISKGLLYIGYIVDTYQISDLISNDSDFSALVLWFYYC